MEKKTTTPEQAVERAFASLEDRLRRDEQLKLEILDLFGDLVEVRACVEGNARVLLAIYYSVRTLKELLGELFSERDIEHQDKLDALEKQIEKLVVGVDLGGIRIESNGDVTIEGDVTGRDKIDTETGGSHGRHRPKCKRRG